MTFKHSSNIHYIIKKRLKCISGSTYYIVCYYESSKKMYRWLIIYIIGYMPKIALSTTDAVIHFPSETSTCNPGAFFFFW